MVHFAAKKARLWHQRQLSLMTGRPVAPPDSLTAEASSKALACRPWSVPAANSAIAGGRQLKTARKVTYSRRQTAENGKEGNMCAAKDGKNDKADGRLPSVESRLCDLIESVL